MLNFPPGSHLSSSTRNRRPGPRLGRMPQRARASFPSAHRAAGTAPEALEHRPPLAAVTHREGVLLLRGLMELPLPDSSVSSLVLSFHHPNQVWVSPTTETAMRTTKARGSREPSLAHLPPDQRLPQPRPPSPLAFSPSRPAPRAACCPSSCGPSSARPPADSPAPPGIPTVEIPGAPSLVSSHARYTLGHRPPSLSSRCHQAALARESSPLCFTHCTWLQRPEQTHPSKTTVLALRARSFHFKPSTFRVWSQRGCLSPLQGNGHEGDTFTPLKGICSFSTQTQTPAISMLQLIICFNNQLYHKRFYHKWKLLIIIN